MLAYEINGKTLNVKKTQNKKVNEKNLVCEKKFKKYQSIVWIYF